MFAAPLRPVRPANARMNLPRLPRLVPRHSTPDRSRISLVRRHGHGVESVWVACMHAAPTQQKQEQRKEEGWTLNPKFDSTGASAPARHECLIHGAAASVSQAGRPRDDPTALGIATCHMERAAAASAAAAAAAAATVDGGPTRLRGLTAPTRFDGVRIRSIAEPIMDRRRRYGAA